MMRNRLRNYLIDEEESGSFERGKEKPFIWVSWSYPAGSFRHQRSFGEKNWERAMDILSKSQAQWYRLQAPSSFSQIMHELSETGKMEELKERIRILEEQARQNKRLIEQISEKVRREEELDKEIVKDLNMLGGIPQKAKGDPFKLAKGLLDMSQEEYEQLLGEG